MLCPQPGVGQTLAVTCEQVARDMGQAWRGRERTKGNQMKEEEKKVCAYDDRQCHGLRRASRGQGRVGGHWQNPLS